MASILCEAPSRLRASSHISATSLNQEARSMLATQSWSTAARPRQPLVHPVSMASGRRNLSTTAALHARLIQRPQRPYQFTQLVQLSDGSTFTVRTTNPHPLHRCTKDSRNHVIWQPSEKSLRNIEVDEAGRLAAFRNRFGRGWDAAAGEASEAADPAQPKQKSQTSDSAAAKPAGEDTFDTLADLLSGYAAKEEPTNLQGLSAKEQARKDKKKK